MAMAQNNRVPEQISSMSLFHKEFGAAKTRNIVYNPALNHSMAYMSQLYNQVYYCAMKMARTRQLQTLMTPKVNHQNHWTFLHV